MADDTTDRPTEELTGRLTIGSPEEWKYFEAHNLLFFERYPHLRDALHTAFIRTASLSEPIEKFVFLYGRLCSEDFFEVLLCSGNGYGRAARNCCEVFTSEL